MRRSFVTSPIFAISMFIILLIEGMISFKTSTIMGSIILALAGFGFALSMFNIWTQRRQNH